LRFVVSHSSTIKLWMNGAQRFLVIHDRATRHGSTFSGGGS
jgi:hypothetical protein